MALVYYAEFYRYEADDRGLPLGRGPRTVPRPQPLDSRGQTAEQVQTPFPHPAHAILRLTNPTKHSGARTEQLARDTPPLDQPCTSYLERHLR